MRDTVFYAFGPDLAPFLFFGSALLPAIVVGFVMLLQERRTHRKAAQTQAGADTPVLAMTGGDYGGGCSDGGGGGDVGGCM